MKFITNFLLWCSGSTRSILNRTPTEINKHVGLGGTIFFTGLLAALSGGYAMFVVFEQLLPAIGFGIVWGLMIFNLDRFIVTSMKKKDGFFSQLVLATPRILLAMLIAIVIAVPLELRIFQKEINKELIIIQNEELQANRLAVDSLFQLSNTDLQFQINGFKQEIADKQAIYLQRQKEFDYERLGTESDRTSGHAGYGPLAKEKEKQMLQAEAERKETEALLQPKIDALEKKLLIAMENEDAKFAKDSNTISNYNGIASQLHALNRLKQKEPIIGLAVLFVTLLLLALETAPVFVKLMSPKGPYDDRLNHHEVKSKYHYLNKEKDIIYDYNLNELSREKGMKQTYEVT